MTFTNLKRGERLVNRYNSTPEQFTLRTQVNDMLVNILAKYCGQIDVGMQDKTKMWWKTNIYDKYLNALSAEEMTRTILYGKVLQKAKSGPCYEIVVMNALDEICLTHSNFLCDDGGGGKKKPNKTSKPESNRVTSIIFQISAIQSCTLKNQKMNLRFVDFCSFKFIFWFCSF